MITFNIVYFLDLLEANRPKGCHTTGGLRKYIGESATNSVLFCLFLLCSTKKIYKKKFTGILVVFFTFPLEIVWFPFLSLAKPTFYVYRSKKS